MTALLVILAKTYGYALLAAAGIWLARVRPSINYDELPVIFHRFPSHR